MYAQAYKFGDVKALVRLHKKLMKWSHWNTEVEVYTHRPRCDSRPMLRESWDQGMKGKTYEVPGVKNLINFFEST